MNVPDAVNYISELIDKKGLSFSDIQNIIPDVLPKYEIKTIWKNGIILSLKSNPEIKIHIENEPNCT